MPRKRRPEGTRAPNGASSIYYSETDGYWHGRVTMGVRDDGKPDRRHVQAKTETRSSIRSASSNVTGIAATRGSLVARGQSRSG